MDVDVQRFLGFFLQTFLRYCILPSSTRLRLGGIYIAPLSCRIFIQKLFYQDENMSLRVVDGYISFVFWDSLWKHPLWADVKEFMLTDNLKGMRCRVKIKLQWVDGVIVDVLERQRKLRVRLERREVMDDGVEDVTLIRIERDTHSPALSFVLQDDDFSFRSATDIRDATRGVDGVNCTVPTVVYSDHHLAFSLAECSDRQETPRYTQHMDENTTSRFFDMEAVQIPQKRGKFRVHLNGLGICLYNATWNYKNMPTTEDATEYTRTPSVRSWMAKKFLLSLFPKKNKREEGAREMVNEQSCKTPSTCSVEQLAKAKKRQRELKEEKSVFQHFYDFIGFIEVEVFAGHIDIGGVKATHPYFLHIEFKRMEGRSYLTCDGVPNIDLYRFVMEMTMEEVQAWWCSMKMEGGNPITPPRPGPERNWLESAMQMFKGSSSSDFLDLTSEEEVSSLIRNYGVLLGREEASTVHFVFYRDVTNVYAGEEVSRQVDLPRSGCEVFLDVPELSYGPWLHYSVMQLKEFFFPTTYLPLESLNFELGKPRPLAGFEFFVEFLRDTHLMVPFKRKSHVPSPPFGICDSGRKGVVLISIGRGSQYVQKPQFLLQKEEKQVYESLFTGKDISIATNGIHDKSTVFAHVGEMEFFFDRLDDRQYNGQKLCNFLPSLVDTEVWWYMDYISFFMDLLTDWQFVPQMYHGEALTTEWYNTYDRFVTEFVPCVRRFELIFSGYVLLHVNTNPHNLVFSEDVNDTNSNIFLSFRINGGGHFFLTLPSDAYLLSAWTEVQRPFELYMRSIETIISLPHTHPLCNVVDMTLPFISIDEFRMTGSYIVYTPNQTVPQEKNPVDPATGKTKLTNSLDMDLQVFGMHGFLMAHHICAFVDAFNNLFGSCTCVVLPDEIFWPLSNIQPKLDEPRNVRKKFYEYLREDEPRANDEDMNFTLSVMDIDVTLRTGVGKSPKLNMCCGKFDFSFITQCGVSDITLTLTPISGRFFDQQGDTLLNESFLCCGNMSFSMVQHFGPKPLCTLFHSATELMLNGVSFDMNVEQAAMLTQLIIFFMEQFSIRDAQLLERIDMAERIATLSAERLVSRTMRSKSITNDFSLFQLESPIFNYSDNNDSESHINNTEDSHTNGVRKALQSVLARDKIQPCVPFSELVPEEVATSFYEYLEKFGQAADEAKDYAIATMCVSVHYVRGCVKTGPVGYLEVRMPHGVQFASSTLNDLNSNSRMSVAVQGIELQGFCCQNAIDASAPSDTFAEVFHVATVLRLRQHTAYPLDDGLEFHHEKQRQFVAAHNVEGLFCGMPLKKSWSPPRADSTVLEPQTVGRPLDGDMRDGIVSSMRTSVTREQHVREPFQMQENNDQEMDSFMQQIVELQQRDDDPIRTPSPSVQSLDLVSGCSSRSSIHNADTSQRFATCLSASAYHDEEVEENLDDNYDRSIGSNSDCLTDEGFHSLFFASNMAALSVAEENIDTPFAQPPKSFLFFLRPFFLNSGATSENTMLRYRPALHSSRSGTYNRTYLNAPILHTRFLAAENSHSHRAPQFLTAQHLQRSAQCNRNRAKDQSETWALCRIDNRARSKYGSPSKHLHIEAISPITALVTTHFIQKVYFEAESRFMEVLCFYQNSGVTVPITTMNEARRNNVAPTVVTSSQRCHNSILNKQGIGQKSLIHRKEPSKIRAHQKRWLSKVNMVTLCIPCIEIKVLTDLPLPLKQLSSDACRDGVYTTMLIVRSLQCIIQQTTPPSRVTMQIETISSGSVRVSSLALITQIEYEPLMRKGNLCIEVPGIMYDERKDTIAVFYTTSIRGCGKIEKKYAMETGTCSIKMDTVASYFTRDFLCYVDLLKTVLQRLQETRPKQRPCSQETYSSYVSNAQVLHQKQKTHVFDTLFPTLQTRELPLTPLENFGIQPRSIVRGIVSVENLRIQLIDTHYVKSYITLDTERSNLIVMKQKSVKFIAKIPKRRKGITVTRAKFSLDTSSPQSPSAGCMQGSDKEWKGMQNQQERQRNHSDTDVRLTGKVNSLLIKCYPSLLHILDALRSMSEVTAKVPGGLSKSQMDVSAKFYDLLYYSTRNTMESDFRVACGGSFTLHHLDISLLYSRLNFMQFRGSNLIVYAESRAEPLSSRECVQTHVLIEAISQRLQERLHKWAQRAKMRAGKRLYAARPSVTPQLHLKNSLFFSAELFFFQYVADAVIPASLNIFEGDPTEVPGSQGQSCVFVATVNQLSTGMHQADQNIVVFSDGTVRGVSERKNDCPSRGEQINLHVLIGKITLVSPYRPQATDTIQPQFHQWMCGWSNSLKAVGARRYSTTAALSDGEHLFASEQKNFAWCCAFQVHEMLFKNALPQEITIELKFPLFSAFLNASSDKRLSLKAHLHPFTLTSKSPSVGQQAIDLPSVYFIYAKDEVKRFGVCLMESVEITISPNIISHVMLICERILTVQASLSKRIPVEDEEISIEGHPTQQLQPNPSTSSSSSFKGQFSFFLEGLSASYLTTMTNLRLSIRRLNALADIESLGEHQATFIEVNVDKAQVALVDRDDHDKLLSSLRRASMPSRSDTPLYNAQIAMLQSFSSASVDQARVMHPMGGFIWGLFETTFSLSGGRDNTNNLRSAMENLIATSSVASMDLRELQKLGNTADHWRLSVDSPLIIARIGLIPLLQQSMDELKDLSNKMRLATREEGRLFRKRLSKFVTYRRLTRVRKSIEAAVKRSQRNRMKRLLEMTVQIIPKVSPINHRRAAFNATTERDEFLSEESALLRKISQTKFFTTISNFLVVVPFGDAAYRSIIEEVPDIYVFGGDNSLLNRGRFIPTMALKVKVQRTVFACSLHKTQKCVFPSHITAKKDGSDSFLRLAEDSALSKVKLTARVAINNAHFYCSDGSPLGPNTSVKSILRGAHILGGLGTLTDFDGEESQKSLSKVLFSSIEFPIHLSKHGREVHSAVSIDTSAPKVTLSTRFVSILSQFMQEISSSPFPHSSGSISKANLMRETTTNTKPTNKVQDRHADPADLLAAVTRTKKSAMVYHVDLTAHIESSKMEVYSILKNNNVVSANPSCGQEGMAKSAGQSRSRRVRFSSLNNSKNSLSDKNCKDNVGGDVDAAVSGSPMGLLLTIPLPELTVLSTVTFGGSPSDNEETIIRVEALAKTIEVKPSIMSLAQEIEAWTTIHQQENIARVAKTLELLKRWEGEVASRNIMLHLAVGDVALPVPQAFAAAVAQIRSSSKLVNTQRCRKEKACGAFLTGDHSYPSALVRSDEQRKSRFMSIHVHVRGLRIVLTTDPAATVNLSFFLDERGGSIDFFVTRTFRSPPPWFCQPIFFMREVISFVFCVRRLRLECQAKLEVKSLEMCLPELELCAAVHRCPHRDPSWALTSICVHVPVDVSTDAQPELILRVPYVWQLLIVENLWYRTLIESLQSIQQIFCRGTDIIKEDSRKTAAIMRRFQSIQQDYTEAMLMIVFTVSHCKVRVDLGSGNAHQASLGGINLLLQRIHPATLVCHKTGFDLSLHSFLLRSEGTLSGVANFEKLFLKGFRIENNDRVTSLTLSPAGRTFRDLLRVEKLSVEFKERHLKDVLQCHVSDFCVETMDCVEDASATNVHADISVYRGSIAVTPNTVPVFMNAIMGFKEIVVAQQKATEAKLQEDGVIISSLFLREEERQSASKPIHASDFHSRSTTKDMSTPFLEEAGAILPSVDCKATSHHRSSNSLPSSNDGNSIPFMGNGLNRIPCGQMRLKMKQTTLIIGSTTTTKSNSGCLFASFPEAILSFAECSTESNASVKKIFEIEADNIELFRPGAVKVIILGFRGLNKFEFYSCQKIGEREVGFMLKLRQSNTWVGNPRFQDFQEIIRLIRSFTTQHTNQASHNFDLDDALLETTASGPPSGNAGHEYDEDDTRLKFKLKPSDKRYLKALQPVKFAPQLSFVGDVAVNIDVILNWLGVSEKALPQILHMIVCDRMEDLLSHLSQRTGKK